MSNNDPSEMIMLEDWHQGITIDISDNYASDIHISSRIDDLTFDDLFVDELALRKKYPALQNAWDHYQTIFAMCKAKEQEDNNEL